ncbi:TerB family tellurite resistance protein [Streptomyces laurentii]|jgi:tellurite resistance protein|uniref:TerB family tellurite resistance protein n=1 Tax=Streptomyces laurentii TaxID=39478 RepID=UPI0036CD00CD
MAITKEKPADLGLRWIFQSYWGFDRAPSTTDFEAYGKALLICANADGDLAPQERDFAVGLIAGMHGPDELVEELKSYPGTDDLAKVLSRAKGAKESAGCLVYDTIRVCTADGVLADAERRKIEEMADLLDVSRDSVQEMIAIYKQERELVDRRFRVCYPDPQHRPF